MGPLETIQPRFNYKNHRGLSNGIVAPGKEVRPSRVAALLSESAYKLSGRDDRNPHVCTDAKEDLVTGNHVGCIQSNRAFDELIVVRIFIDDLQSRGGG